MSCEFREIVLVDPHVPLRTQHWGVGLVTPYLVVLSQWPIQQGAGGEGGRGQSERVKARTSAERVRARTSAERARRGAAAGATPIGGRY